MSYGIIVFTYLEINKIRVRSFPLENLNSLCYQLAFVSRKRTCVQFGRLSFIEHRQLMQ